MTRVLLVHVPHRIRSWLRFGHASREDICSSSKRIATFRPESVFCRVLWHTNRRGSVLYQLAILQSARVGEAIQTVAGIDPGAKLLLRANDRRTTNRVLELIASIEARGIDPADVSPAYWMTVHNRACARLPLPEYTFARHAAHVMRRTVT